MAYRIRIPKSRKELVQDGSPCNMPKVHGVSPIPQGVGTVGTPGTPSTPDDQPLSEIVLDPAVRPDDTPLAPVYWQQANGEIKGPARPEFLARLGNGPKSSFWVIALYEGLPVWIRWDVLRSKKTYEEQVKATMVEPIKDPR